ncbi:hypothetical protein EDD15DRAFT_2250105 [Pisolithus albus]|nr:hypothetical protein EDD15DRAFT_2250105 [Pisolithus albus]
MLWTQLYQAFLGNLWFGCLFYTSFVEVLKILVVVAPTHIILATSDFRLALNSRGALAQTCIFFPFYILAATTRQEQMSQ